MHASAPIYIMERRRLAAGSVHSISYVLPNLISGTCWQYPAACGVPDTAEFPTQSLHVHERIDPKTIIDTVQKEETGPAQMSLFETEKKPLREAIEFYKHKEGWSRLARNLKAEIDEEKIKAFKGTASLPFEKGDNAKIAVKIIDDRGIESLRVISL